MKQSGLWSSPCTRSWLSGGYIWWLCISGSGEIRNFDFLRFDLEDQGQPPCKTIGILTNVIHAAGPNLVILAWMDDELWCGQAQNGVNLDFDLIFDLECQCRLLHKTIGTLTKLFCTFGLNLVILAWMGPELSRGQASDWHTDWHTHTDAGNDNTRRPKLASGKNWFANWFDYSMYFVISFSIL